MNDSKTDAFWAVGLEPYFQYPILLDQALPFWVPSISYHTEAGFQQAVERRPGVVLLEYHSWLPFDQSADIAGEHVSYLENQGYHYVRTFCGAQIAGWSAKVTECHVVFER